MKPTEAESSFTFYLVIGKGLKGFYKALKQFKDADVFITEYS